MCGIIGIWAKNSEGQSSFGQMTSALNVMSHRGPDYQGIKTYSKVCLGHARLSIIDLSADANQPMEDSTGRYSLIFNGEIYNYQELRSQLELEGCRFHTNSDTEVLMQLLLTKGLSALEKLNGFFAFVFYDKEEDRMLFARDRFGIKPLLFYEDDEKIILTSELSPLFKFNIDKTIDDVALNQYFRLTYIPAPSSILKRAFKVLPGQYGIIDQEGLQLKRYYKLERKPIVPQDFIACAEELKSRLTISVKDRMIADVPVGAFLSGGVDSSIIAAVAKHQKEDLKTFSIGFDHPYFNESQYSDLMAKHIGTDHHEFIVGKKEFQSYFERFLDSIDEPFGDSSAFAVYFLAEQTKKEVTVALSGDGADELFGGYKKHQAEYKMRRASSSKKRSVKWVSKILKNKAVSRSDKFGDFNRKLQKFSNGIGMTPEERYFEWCTFVDKQEVYDMLEPSFRTDFDLNIPDLYDMGDYLIADQKLVLPNDMLKKVDMMSMAHALEVRTPFLDHRVVEYANSVPLEFKLNPNAGKLLLKKAFDKEVPKEILFREKRGFEVPIQDWLGDEINGILNSELFSAKFLEDQNMFDKEYIGQLIKGITNNNFGERIYLIWSLIVFQNWYKKFYC
ncbi:asparagine synthase (glutamine-hydrolyzing) [Paracrocinitomix mangrovi]|uniref:asparagine synthase (glutamine-hydrolyzing) n=1 Tax=Paracrocinitomix mangrovi TaxID=2862509 RepID=UPI001C8D3D93|nr:asparagine synthase (glutamine-hydrolyzing) [Paracrocinitomix mangrovi]UKN02217.1 asparagine synthase (glutamine-hydrolyzing) [Paracrocinitomix mangrovi]